MTPERTKTVMRSQLFWTKDTIGKGSGKREMIAYRCGALACGKLASETGDAVSSGGVRGEH
jgi:hypothetical protein